MSLYFGTTEITKLRDLTPQTGLDITGLWFGETNVYTVWQTYEGTLPATFNANGDDMKQYQIYGNTGGVGDRTENLFDKNATDENNGYVNNKYLISSGSENYSNSYFISEYIPITGGKNYVLCNAAPISLAASICFYTSEKVYISGVSYDLQETVTFTAPANAAYARATVYKTQTNVMLTEGSTVPASFVTYGYKLDMAIGSNILQSSEIEQGGWDATAGTVPQKTVNPKRCRSKNMYSISGEKLFYDFKSLNVNIAFVNNNERSLGGTGFKTGVGSVDVPENAVKCLFIIANTDTSTNILPAQVIAAGIWASVDATTTPIYIGDDPLGEDEYVDYQAQKIYRMIDGVLTPTDPPVPLPALPTCEGTTVIDYDGTPAPSGVYVKYKKGW